MEPRPRVARDDAGKQRQVVLDDRRVNLVRGEVDDAETRLAEQKQEEQESLLVRLEGRAAVEDAVEGGGRDDDDRLPCPIETHRVPHRRQASLQRLESLLPRALAERPQRDRLGGKRGHAGIRASLSPTMLCAVSGRENPFSSRSVTGVDTTNSSTAACTRGLTRICPSAAAAHRRCARFVTVPTALYSTRPANPICPSVAYPCASPTEKPRSCPLRRHPSASSAILLRIATPIRTARSGASGHGMGSLKSTMTPSPVNEPSVPSKRKTSSPRAVW